MKRSDSMNQEKIGLFISKCRKDKNLTQSELAEILGVTDKSISNWECGRNMPDLSLFKPLCEVLDISINDLISGEKVSNDKYQETLEDNIIKTIDYTNKKVSAKNNLLGIILITFGVMITITAMTIFPSESSWGSIYAIFGVIISLLGLTRFTKKLKPLSKILVNVSFLIISILILFLIDYLSVINIKQAPRFSIYKITGETTIYYDTPFYDVIRCKRDTKDEYYKIMPNTAYDKDNTDKYCQ